MHASFEFLLLNAGVATLLALGVFLLSRFHFRPALLHLMWVVVLVRLVAPPVLRWPVTVNPLVVAEQNRNEPGTIGKVVALPDGPRSTFESTIIKSASSDVSEFDSRKTTVAVAADGGGDSGNDPAVAARASQRTPSPSAKATTSR